MSVALYSRRRSKYRWRRRADAAGAAALSVALLIFGGSLRCAGVLAFRELTVVEC